MNQNNGIKDSNRCFLHKQFLLLNSNILRLFKIPHRQIKIYKTIIPLATIIFILHPLNIFLIIHTPLHFMIFFPKKKKKNEKRINLIRLKRKRFKCKSKIKIQIKTKAFWINYRQLSPNLSMIKAWNKILNNYHQSSNKKHKFNLNNY